MKITLVQFSPIWESSDKNLVLINRLIDSISQTDIIILPEMFNTGFSTKNPDKIVKNNTIEFIKQKSIEKDCAICGSIIFNENQKYYNRFIFITPDNIQFYDKRHLFTMGKETDKFTKGTKRTIIKYKDWKILPQICYDLRFPVWSKNTYYNNEYDYDMIIYVASWPSVRNEAWKKLLPARAIENLSYVVAVNRYGIDGNNIKHSGNSRVIDYQGNELLLLPEDSESIESIELNKEELKQFRLNFNFGQDWDDFIMS